MKDDLQEIDGKDLVELDFLEAVAARLPGDAAVLKALGDLYTRAGRYENGLEVDHRLAKLCPLDPMVWYNLGCSLALTRQRDEALRSLKKAVELGYNDYKWMSEDADLQSLRDDKGFKSLIKNLTTCKEKRPHESGSA